MAHITTYNRYLRTWFLGAVFSLFAAGLFNVIIDPYGFFNVTEIKGVNQQKEGVRSKIRYVKAIAISLQRPATLLFGSSRIHDGVNPGHPLLQAYPPAYNLGIDMVRMHEALGFLKHAVKNTNVKRIVFGLDLFMFNAAEKVNPAFDPSLVGRKIAMTDLIFMPLFTKTAFEDSMKTFKLSHTQSDRKEFLSNGYRPGNFVFYKLKDYAKLHTYTNSVFLFPSKPPATPYYGYFSYGEAAYQDLEEFLSICKQEHIDLRLFITPAHADLDGEGIRIAGLWDIMENWKQRLSMLSDKYNVPLWDFSGYNSITTEKVRTPMRYYWDSSHFTEVTSDLILTRILGDRLTQRNVPSDFGVLLTMQNIDAHLSAVRVAQKEYARTHETEVRLIRKIYQDGQRGIQPAAEQTKGIFE